MIHLAGTAGSPLAATRTYSFRRHDADLCIDIPVAFRGTWDDHGLVERPEQKLFVDRLMSSLDVRRADTRTSGEWRFEDAASLEKAWTVVAAALREPVATAPSAPVNRDVSIADAPIVSKNLPTAYLELVSCVAGLSGDPFVSASSTTDTADYETKRREIWKRGEVLVNINATAIESGYGIHGETIHFSIVGSVGDGRNASASAKIDMRSGGWVSASVQGVFDGQALVEAFMTTLFAKVGAAADLR